MLLTLKMRVDGGGGYRGRIDEIDGDWCTVVWDADVVTLARVWDVPTKHLVVRNGVAHFVADQSSVKQADTPQRGGRLCFGGDTGHGIDSDPLARKWNGKPAAPRRSR